MKILSHTYYNIHISLSRVCVFAFSAASTSATRINCSVKVDKFIHGLTDLSQTQTKDAERKDH